jgi:hypothetical protein
MTAFSAVNYTDWSAAIGRSILVLTFVDRGVLRGQSGGTPTAINRNSLDRSRYFFFQVAPHLSPRGRVYPIPDQMLLRKSGSAGNGTRDLCVCSQELRPLGHRGGPRIHLEVLRRQWHLAYGFRFEPVTSGTRQSAVRCVSSGIRPAQRMQKVCSNIAPTGTNCFALHSSAILGGTLAAVDGANQLSRILPYKATSQPEC